MGITIDNLANEITAVVREYTEDVTTGVAKEVDKTSKQVTKEISAKSPRRVKGGEYAKGWTRKKVADGGSVSYTIYNKRKPGLAHLLEKGHAKRGGGRVPGTPHIGPSIDQEVPQMVNRIKSIIRNGG